jgi:hypothetical protein
MGDPLHAMLLIALLPFASARTYGGGHYSSHNPPEVATSTCTWKESCYAVDYCAIKHNNDDMITFRDGRVCDDLNGEYFKSLKWNENLNECRICNNRRKGRKLLGGPIPLNSAKSSSPGPVCCALKPEECCMQNPYAWSGLPYDEAHGLIFTFNVIFWFYLVAMCVYLFFHFVWTHPEENHSQNGARAQFLTKITPRLFFFRVLRFTILFWTFLAWFPLYIMLSSMLKCRKNFLIYAARKGHTEIVKALLAAPNIDVNAKDDAETAALILAARHGHTEIVKALLAAPNIDVNAKDWEGNTALCWAADRGHTEIVKALLAAPNIDVNAKDRSDTTPLSHAARCGHTEIVKALLAAPNIEKYNV